MRRTVQEGDWRGLGAWMRCTVVLAGLGSGGGCLLASTAIARPPELVPFAVPQYDYETYTLPNGLLVALAPDPQTNLVKVDVRYGAGALDEAPSKTGLAHLAEHVSYLPEISPGVTLAARLDATALQHNGWTSYEHTHYASVALSSRLGELLSIEAARMTVSCDRVPEQEFQRERAVVMQEIAQRETSSGIQLALQGALWGNTHRLADHVGGSQVPSLQRADACRFLEQEYQPNHAVLVISGAFTPAEARSYVASHFRSLVNRAPATARAVARPDLEAPGYPLSLDIDAPIAGISFLLADEGTSVRQRQDMLFPALQAAIEAMVPYTPGAQHGGLVQLGSPHSGAVVLYFEGTTSSDTKYLFEGLEQAIEITDRFLHSSSSLAALHQQQRHAANELVALQDSLGTRGVKLAEHLLATRTAYRGQDLHAILTASPAEMATLASESFARSRGRRVLILPGRNPSTQERLQLLSELGGAVSAEIRDAPLARRLERAALATSHELPRVATELSEFSLSNGLRVAVARRRGATFEARLLFPVGTAADPQRREGTARWTAQLLSMPRASSNSRLGKALQSAELASSIWTEVHGSTTEFRITGLSRTAELHLWHLQTLLRNGEIDDERLGARQQSLREQMAQRQSRYPQARARVQRMVEIGWTAMFGVGHPYVRVGQQNDGLSVSRSDLESFRNEHYIADGAVLVVVSDREVAEIRAIIERLWAPWSGRSRVVRALVPAAAPARGPTYVGMDHPSVQHRLELLFATRSSPASAGVVRKVLVKMLEGRISELRDRLAATYGISIDYIDTPAGGLVKVDGRISRVKPEEALRTLLSDLDLQSMEPAARLALFEGARRLALEESLGRGSSASWLAEFIAYSALEKLPADHINQRISEVRSLTLDAVLELARQDLDPKRMVLTLSGDGAVATLRALGGAPVTVID